MQEILNKAQKYLMNTYRAAEIVFDKGDACYLTDTDGNEYLDFVSGIAVNSLGYNNKDFIEAMTARLQKLNHCSNLYVTEPQVNLAELMIENSDFTRVFFCNSGTESVEAALKLAKKFGKTSKSSDCTRIIAMQNSFHGRTMGALSVTGQEKYRNNFNPLIPGVDFAEFNNLESVKKLVGENTCAIIAEPIQGEGGVHPAAPEFLQGLRTICDEHNIALIFDEVQCGIGRTGELFGYQTYGVVPDIICLAKGLGNGFPVGAMMAKGKFSEVLTPGDHASTFGGNPLAATAGLVVLSTLLNKGLLQQVKESSAYLRSGLEVVKQKYSVIRDIRGKGLLLGVEITKNAVELAKKCLKDGLLLLPTGENILRFLPPLTVTRDEIDSALKIFEKTL